jgi:hypothetical protein
VGENLWYHLIRRLGLVVVMKTRKQSEASVRIGSLVIRPAANHFNEILRLKRHETGFICYYTNNKNSLREKKTAGKELYLEEPRCMEI